jgi:hypothetical protein
MAHESAYRLQSTGRGKLISYMPHSLVIVLPTPDEWAWVSTVDPAGSSPA